MKTEIRRKIPGELSPLPLAKLVFVRHGHTNYTDEFPDLTKDGEVSAKQAGILIRQRIKGFPFMFVSSPAVRARGTMHLIMKELGHTEGHHIVDPMLREAVIFDEEVLKARLQRLLPLGQDHLCKTYETDPFCEDGIHIESRSSVIARFYGYLEYILKIGVSPQNGLARNKCVVHTTHYEVLFHFVKNIFNLNYETDKPLQCGEVIVVGVFATDLPGIFGLRAEFRGKQNLVYFDCQKKELFCV